MVHFESFVKGGRCSGLGGHLAAFLGALVAGLGALLAVFHVLLGAFVATRLADVGAQGADGIGVLATAGHRGGGQLANRSAVHIERDAARHHLDVLLVQAGCGAMIAGHGAGVAGFEARKVFLVRHG